LVWLAGIFLASQTIAVGKMPTDETAPVNVASDRKSAVPEEIKTVLSENAAILGTCDLRFSIDRQYLVPNLPRPIKEDHDFYLEDGRLRHRFSLFFPAAGAVVQTVERAFDGKVFYYGSGNGTGSPMLTRLLGEIPEDPAAKYYPAGCASLLALGIDLPTTVYGWKNFSLTSWLLKLTSDAESLSIEAGGNSLLKLTLQIPEPAVVYSKSLDLEEFETCSRDSTDPVTLGRLVQRYQELRSMNILRKVELWLDPARGYALKRQVDSTLDGRLIQTIECENFESTGRGQLWIPRESTIRTFLKLPDELDGFAEEAVRTDTVTLQSFSFNPRKDVSFVISYGPGAYITDRSTAAAGTAPEGKVTFIEPADVNALREAANRARPRLSVIVFINVFVLFVLVGVVLWRRRAGR